MHAKPNRNLIHIQDIFLAHVWDLQTRPDGDDPVLSLIPFIIGSSLSQMGDLALHKAVPLAKAANYVVLLCV